MDPFYYGTQDVIVRVSVINESTDMFYNNCFYSIARPAAQSLTRELL